MKMQLTEITKAFDTTIGGNNDPVTNSVASDSRKTNENALFAPLKGERDEHNFINSAIANDAVATLWEKGHPNKPDNFPVVEVDNTLTTTQELTKYCLNKVNPIVVGITSSNGKTITKDIVAAVLSKRLSMHKTQANSNNEIGVPVAILEMRPTTEILVLEMGMDRTGQLHHLNSLVKPDVCVITMIGKAHIEFFGSRGKITDAKMEIINFLEEDSEFIYSDNESLLRQRTEKISQTKSTFGSNDQDIIYVLEFKSHTHHTSFVTSSLEQKFSVPMIGRRNVSNAVAAVCVGYHSGETDDGITTSLSNFTSTTSRIRWCKENVGEDIMDDIYNSSPTAAKTVLTSFGQVEVPGGRGRVAALGDTLELGLVSAALHASLAEKLDPLVINEIYLYRSEAKNLEETIKDKYAPASLHYYPQDRMERMIDDFKNDTHSNDIVMPKASHDMHLDKILERSL